MKQISFFGKWESDFKFQPKRGDLYANVQWIQSKVWSCAFSVEFEKACDHWVPHSQIVSIVAFSGF